MRKNAAINGTWALGILFIFYEQIAVLFKINELRAFVQYFQLV